MMAVDLACLGLVQGKHPGLPIIGVFIRVIRVIVSGCGSTEMGVYRFGFGTYPQRRGGGGGGGAGKDLATLMGHFFPNIS